MMKRSKILGTDAQTFLDQQDFVKIHVLGKSLMDKEVDPSLNVDEIVTNNSHVLSEMLHECTFQDQECSAANFTSFLSLMVKVNDNIR